MLAEWPDYEKYKIMSLYYEYTTECFFTLHLMWYENQHKILYGVATVFGFAFSF